MFIVSTISSNQATIDSYAVIDLFLGSSGTTLKNHTITPVNSENTSWAWLGAPNYYLTGNGSATISSSNPNNESLTAVNVSLADAIVSCTVYSQYQTANTYSKNGIIIKGSWVDNYVAAYIDPDTGVGKLFSKVGGNIVGTVSVSIPEIAQTDNIPVFVKGWNIGDDFYASFEVGGNVYTITVLTDTNFSSVTNRGLIYSPANGAGELNTPREFKSFKVK